MTSVPWSRVTVQLVVRFLIALMMETLAQSTPATLPLVVALLLIVRMMVITVPLGLVTPVPEVVLLAIAINLATLASPIRATMVIVHTNARAYS